MVEALQHDLALIEGDIDTPDAFYLNAADTLAGLSTVPEAEPASRLLRHLVGPRSDSSSVRDLTDTLIRVRMHLLVEANPDYWLEQMAVPESDLDGATVEMTASVANERQQQALLVSALLDRLNTDFPLILQD